MLQGLHGQQPCVLLFPFRLIKGSRVSAISRPSGPIRATKLLAFISLVGQSLILERGFDV
jgi:hypothetical protein